jgi:hypothetical protein
MSQTMNLKDVERRAWTLYFEDGLWDLFFGFLFLAGGLRTLADSLWSYLLVGVGLLIFIVGRRAITLPRIGVIKFGRKRRASRQKLLILILAAVVLTFAVLLLPFLGLATPGTYAGLIFAIAVPLILAIVAYFMDFRRLYGYAVLVAIFMMLTEMVSLQVGAMAQIVAGGIALLIGSWHLFHFMKKYPLPDEAFMGEGNNNGQS